MEKNRSPELRARLRLAILAVLASVAGGTLGYHFLWKDIGGTWIDALYMTVITLTTIGYGEVHPTDTPARWFTMALAIIGVANLLYFFSVGMEFLVVAQLQDWRGRRKMEREIGKLTDHVIIAGLGRVGLEAARELAAAGLKIVALDVVDTSVERAAKAQVLFMQGDATVDAVLEQAGIQRAASLIACSGSDATNLYIVLSARLLNPRLTIVSRVIEEANEPKLMKAGANRAISPYAMGGRRLAHLILSPGVVELFETAMAHKGETLDIEDIVVSQAGDGVALEGDTLASLREKMPAATILCVVRDGKPLARPGPDLALRIGDHLLAFGTARQLTARAPRRAES